MHILTNFQIWGLVTDKIPKHPPLASANVLMKRGFSSQSHDHVSHDWLDDVPTKILKIGTLENKTLFKAKS